MIGIITMSHGNFAEEILNSIHLVIGKHEYLTALTLLEHDGVNDLDKKFKSAMDQFNLEEGVLVLVDVLGGTPYNVAMMNSQKYNCAIISGLNFPMLIEAVGSRDCMELKELAQTCLEASRQGIQYTNVNKEVK